MLTLGKEQVIFKMDKLNPPVLTCRSVRWRTFKLPDAWKSAKNGLHVLPKHYEETIIIGSVIGVHLMLSYRKERG